MGLSKELGKDASRMDAAHKLMEGWHPEFAWDDSKSKSSHKHACASIWGVWLDDAFGVTGR